MTVANRAIGAPINIWNDHCDSMSQRDSGWIQLYAETNQEAADLHVQAFRLAEELVAAGDGVHGRLRPHPRRRARSSCPTQEQVDAFLPPFEPRQVLDPDDPVTIGAMVGPEAFTEVALPRCTPSSCRRSTRSRAIADDFAAAFGRDSGGLVRALPRRRRRDRRRRARLGARHASRTSSTSCASEGERVGALGDHAASGRSRSTRSARRSAGARRVVVLEKAFAVGAGGIVGQNVRAGARRAWPIGSTTVVAGLGGRPVTERRCAACSTDARRRAARARSTFLDLDARRRRARARGCEAPRRAARREHAARLGIVAGGPLMPEQPIKFYQVGLASRSATACSTPTQRTVQADPSRSNTLTSGHRACQGCGEALGARYALDAAMRATRRPADRGQRDRLPRGLLDAVPGELVAAARGSTRCSATRPRWPPASRRR